MKFQVALLFKDGNWAQRNIDVPDELREDDGLDEDVVTRFVVQMNPEDTTLLHVCILYYGEEREGMTIQDLPKG